MILKTVEFSFQPNERIATTLKRICTLFIEKIHRTTEHERTTTIIKEKSRNKKKMKRKRKSGRKTKAWNKSTRIESL